MPLAVTFMSMNREAIYKTGNGRHPMRQNGMTITYRHAYSGHAYPGHAYPGHTYSRHADRVRRSRRSSRRKAAIRPLRILCIVLLAVSVLFVLRSSARTAERSPARTAVIKRERVPFQAGRYGTPELIQDLQQEHIPAYGNQETYIAIHYLGVSADGHAINEDGTGAHFYIYADGTIYQSATLDSVPWQVGTAGCYERLHPHAGNFNTIGIELCPRCDGDETNDKDPAWYFTEETQESCALLVRALMRDLNINEENVLRHGDIVNKHCPAPYFNNNRYKTSWTWQEFRDNTFSLSEEEIPYFSFAE